MGLIAMLLGGVAVVCFAGAAIMIGLMISGVILLLPIIITQFDDDLFAWTTLCLPVWWLFLYLVI